MNTDDNRVQGAAALLLAGAGCLAVGRRKADSDDDSAERDAVEVPLR